MLIASERTPAGSQWRERVGRSVCQRKKFWFSFFRTGTSAGITTRICTWCSTPPNSGTIGKKKKYSWFCCDGGFWVYFFDCMRSECTVWITRVVLGWRCGYRGFFYLFNFIPNRLSLIHISFPKVNKHRVEAALEQFNRGGTGILSYSIE